VSAASGLKSELHDARTNVNGKISAATKEKDEEIGQLKVNCAYQSGAAGAFQQQISGLQGQLNTCIIQQKETPLMRKFIVSRDSRPGTPKLEYILTTNVTATPAKVAASCNIPIADFDVNPMTENGASNSSIGKFRSSNHEVSFDLESPAWSPASPLWVTIFFTPPVNAMPKCNFEKR
jgi:hypothetical protein